MAGATGNVFLYLYLFGYTLGYFFVSKFDLDAEVAAANATHALTASSATATKEATKDIVAKNITELAENIFHVRGAATIATATALYTGMTKAIVLSPLIGIAQ